MVKNAIVRIPCDNFADGLTSVDLGAPRLDIVLDQHARYCDALRDCGLTVTTLEAAPRYPDSTFVEDTAVITERGAILTRPGAVSREGEVSAIRAAIAGFFAKTEDIEVPGTLDGGDVCEAGEHFFIGVSLRTNEEGARQLSGILAAMGYTSSTIDIRGMKSILHLKSGISYIGENTMLVMEELAGTEAFRDYERVVVSTKESYAANCVWVNERILVAEGYPKILADLQTKGFRPLALAMSEFQKMDGGLSCLSLRF